LLFIVFNEKLIKDNFPKLDLLSKSKFKVFFVFFFIYIVSPLVMIPHIFDLDFPKKKIFCLARVNLLFFLESCLPRRIFLSE